MNNDVGCVGASNPLGDLAVLATFSDFAGPVSNDNAADVITVANGVVLIIDIGSFDWPSCHFLAFNMFANLLLLLKLLYLIFYPLIELLSDL